MKNITERQHRRYVYAVYTGWYTRAALWADWAWEEVFDLFTMQ